MRARAELVLVVARRGRRGAWRRRGCRDRSSTSRRGTRRARASRRGLPTRTRSASIAAGTPRHTTACSKPGEPQHLRHLRDVTEHVGQVADLHHAAELAPARDAELQVADQRLARHHELVHEGIMVSGETIVRDLQMGIHRATELGGAMEVGYLPDMFGHVAQMPQILRRRARARGGVARRAGGGHPDRVLVGGARRLARARRVPLRLVLQRARPARRREAAHRPRADGYELELGDARCPAAGCCS